MAEVKTVKERLTETFDDENVYTEFRDKIKDTILNRLYYSKYKETHFYTSPEVFDQFLDMIIEDMLNDRDFEKYIEIIKKLQNSDKKEEALEGLKKENETKITNLRMSAKNYCLETFLPKMGKELISFTSNPFELKSHESKVGIFKGTNGSEEFVRVDESSENDKKHDFDVNLEYIIPERQYFWTGDSYDGYGMRNSHNGSKFLIYMPSRETVYPEGTHLSDLIRIKNKNIWKEQLRNIVTSLKSDGANSTDIRNICGSIIEEERESE